MITKRKNPPPGNVFKMRKAWGQHLQDCLDHHDIKRKSLASLVGYKLPSSVTQIVSGQQGISLFVYSRIVSIFPEMLQYPYPEPAVVDLQKGSPGPHKVHEYPSGTTRRPPIRGRRPPRFGGTP